ncbi:MAG: membrane protein insertase YidC [Bacteroidales bacterium]
MNKDSVIGFLLIGLILVVFSVYSSKQYKEQARIQFEKDSIAAVNKANYEAEVAARVADSLKKVQPTSGVTIKDNTVINNQGVAKTSATPVTYTNPFLEKAYNDTAKIYTLENSKLKLNYTTKGAQLSQTLIKNYFTYDSLALHLIKENASEFGLQLYTGQYVNTKDFVFRAVKSNDSLLVMRLNFSDDAYIDYAYKLKPDSYVVDFNVITVGMENFIPRNATQIDLSWNVDIPRLEKGYKNEKNYSMVSYKFPNEKSVEQIGGMRGGRKSEGGKEITTKFQWFAYQQQFFSAIMVADNNFLTGKLSQEYYPEEDPDMRLMKCNMEAAIAYNTAHEVNIPFHFYYGPNSYRLLRSYKKGFERIIPMGKNIVAWISRGVIVPLFDLLHRFISNYGLIILLMTFIIKIVVSPLTYNSYASSAKMRLIKPEVDKINAKYSKEGDSVKKQQATMALYKSAGVNMYSGCLPMLLQFPILIAMYRFFPASIELRQQSFLWAHDLSTYDSIFNLGFNIPLYGSHVSLFALLMGVTMYISAKMNTGMTAPSSGGGAGDANMNMMNNMTKYFMPIFMVLICNNFSAGLSYYYMLSNIITIGQTWAIRKYFVDEDKIKATMAANQAKNSGKGKSKSKFQQRLEAAMKAQQEAAKKNARR